MKGYQIKDTMLELVLTIGLCWLVYLLGMYAVMSVFVE